MRIIILVSCLLAAQISLTIAQGVRGRSGWSGRSKLDAALRAIGLGNRGPGPDGSVSSLNIPDLIKSLRHKTTEPTTMTTQKDLVTPELQTPKPTEAPATVTPELQTPKPTEAPATVTQLSQANLETIRGEFVILFREGPVKIAKYVQMGFHVCVGKCDGCLNTRDSANKGLVPHYTELRQLYRKWQDVLSLADFAVISAFEAVKAGVGRNARGCNSRRCSIDLTFVSGRRTCANPDVPPTPTFPKGEDIFAPAGLANDFQLTETEMVALLGCHSLGRAHVTVSGFDGPWDLSPTILDNGYYQALNQVTSWSQKFMPGAGAHQWNGETNNGAELMMLHADMILQHSFTVSGANHTGSCPTTVGCPLANTANTVQTFARNNNAFLRTLSVAVVKMCNTADFDATRRREFN